MSNKRNNLQTPQTEDLKNKKKKVILLLFPDFFFWFFFFLLNNLFTGDVERGRWTDGVKKVVKFNFLKKKKNCLK